MSVTSSRSSLSQHSEKQHKVVKKEKGKQRAENNITERKNSVTTIDGTTDKLVSLITCMAARLDEIEEKLDALPNRS
jgi:hypothetical protein